MTKDDIVAAFRGGAKLTETLPVTGPIVKRVAERLAAGEPALWKAVEPSWTRRHFATPRDAWLLLLNGFHYEALRRPGHPLAPFLPTCRGQAGDATKAVDTLLDEPGEHLVKQLTTRSRASYWEGWGALWVNPAALFFQSRGLPYIVAEVGTIGGLYACADLLAPQPGVDSRSVASRVGFDSQPLRLESPEDRAWLLGAILPDNVDHFRSAQLAIDKFRALKNADGEPPVQLVPCEAALSARAIRKNVQPEPDLGLLVLTTFASQRMTEPEHAQFRRDMQELLGEWEQRALWLELAPVAGGRPTVDYELGGHRLARGKLNSRQLIRVELGGEKPFSWDEAANQAFLR